MAPTPPKKAGQPSTPKNTRSTDVAGSSGKRSSGGTKTQAPSTATPSRQRSASPKTKQEILKAFDKLGAIGKFKANQYLKAGMSLKDAYFRVADDLEQEQAAKGKADAVGQGNCPECTKDFNKYEDRDKLQSLKCGHVLCKDCVDNRFSMFEGLCKQEGCQERLKAEDFKKWQPPSQPSGHQLGEVPNYPFGQVPEFYKDAAYDDGKGLFVSEGESDE